MTNREIGRQMFLAEKTVKNYVAALLAKLGMQRRVQAAVLANQVKDHTTGRPERDLRPCRWRCPGQQPGCRGGETRCQGRDRGVARRAIPQERGGGDVRSGPGRNGPGPERAHVRAG